MSVDVFTRRLRTAEDGVNESHTWMDRLAIEIVERSKPVTPGVLERLMDGLRPRRDLRHQLLAF